MDMQGIIMRIFGPILSVIFLIVKIIFGVLFFACLLFFVVFLVRYRVNLFRLDAERLRSLQINFLPYDLLRYFLVDLCCKPPKQFSEYGFTFYCGRQGAGKTISMVHYLDNIKRNYPKCIIVTNFAYDKADFVMSSWRDFMSIRNGEDGVIFAIDEIHSEYSSSAWRDFPESLLSEISQQRKQRIKIVATAQVFGRVAKPLREQAFSVVQCKTVFGRLVSNVEYDANDYAICMDKLYRLKDKIKPIRKSWFVQSDSLRRSYDTYQKIERLQKVDFMPRFERR